MNKDVIAIVGGGPAGLFCAHQLLKKGVKVDLYDHSSGLAKKFLIAGNGGLNLTHSEDLDSFSKRYGVYSEFFKELLNDFSPQDLREWCLEVGVETFVGTSGRVFPKKLKAGEMLLEWTKQLKVHSGFNLYLKHSLINVSEDKTLTFKHKEQEIKKKYDKIILALGGASWKKTGSDGKWAEFLSDLDIELKPFVPMNCGFEMDWGEYIKKNLERTPLKNIEISVADKKVRGEVMLTPYGIEGGAIYAISNIIRDQMTKDNNCTITLDLKPDLNVSDLKELIEKRNNKKSLSQFLQNKLKLPKQINAILIELLEKEKLTDSDYLAVNLKALKLELIRPRPIDEAISTGGGVSFESLSANLELKNHPGIYIIGEMLDYEAPTGGYLLQGCFSTAYRVISSI